MNGLNKMLMYLFVDLGRLYGYLLLPIESMVFKKTNRAKQRVN